MLGSALHPSSNANSPVRAVSLRSSQHRLERHALDRANRFPELAARAVPDEPLRAVTAVRATIASVRHRNRPQAIGDTSDRRTALLGRQRPELRCIDEIGEYGVLEHKPLERVAERHRAAEVADDCRVGEIAMSSARYRCSNCGYSAQRFIWHCPSCKLWETARPIQTLPFETVLT